MATLPKRFLRNYTIYFSVWDGICPLLLHSDYRAEIYHWREDSGFTLHGVLARRCYIFALLTPVVIWLGKRFPFHKDNRLCRGLLHLLFSLVFSVA
jgi:hypothetical protein